MAKLSKSSFLEMLKTGNTKPVGTAIVPASTVPPIPTFQRSPPMRPVRLPPDHSSIPLPTPPPTLPNPSPTAWGGTCPRQRRVGSVAPAQAKPAFLQSDYLFKSIGGRHKMKDWVRARRACSAHTAGPTTVHGLASAACGSPMCVCCLPGSDEGFDAYASEHAARRTRSTRERLRHLGMASHRLTHVGAHGAARLAQA